MVILIVSWYISWTCEYHLIKTPNRHDEEEKEEGPTYDVASIGITDKVIAFNFRIKLPNVTAYFKNEKAISAK